MRHLRLPSLRLVLGLAAVVATATAALAQGSLTPPGAPGPTMKTLDQIEARIPLGTPNQISTSTLTITAPGSYVLMGPVEVATGSGIVISTSNVTLDLNGFTVSSTNTSGNTDHGIALTGTNSIFNVSIANGFIAGSYTVAFDGTATGTGFSTGISGGSARNVQIARVSVRGARRGGISVSDDSSLVTACHVAHTGSTGITGDLVENCTVDAVAENATGISANTVRHSRAILSAGGVGIRAENLVADSSANGVSIGIRAALVTNSRGGGSIGIFATVSVGNSVGFSISPGSPEGYGIHCETGTVSFSRGVAAEGDGDKAIVAAIAVACTTGGGPIEAPQKHLGTP